MGGAYCCRRDINIHVSFWPIIASICRTAAANGVFFVRVDIWSIFSFPEFSTRISLIGLLVNFPVFLVPWTLLLSVASKNFSGCGLDGCDHLKQVERFFRSKAYFIKQQFWGEHFASCWFNCVMFSAALVDVAGGPRSFSLCRGNSSAKFQPT